MDHIQRQTATFPFPYDLGSKLENCNQILGKRWWMWLIPTELEGNGMDFSISHRSLWTEEEYISLIFEKTKKKKKEEQEQDERDKVTV